MKRIPRWLIVVLALAVGAIALRFTVLAPARVPVEIARVETGVVEESVSNTRAGTVKARRRAKLSPQLGGRVVELPARKGAHTDANALLLRLDDSVQRAQLKLAEEDVRTADARAREACLAAELAQRELDRGVALEKDGIASPQMLDTLGSTRDRADATCKAAQAMSAQSRAQVQVARASLALTEVRAPFAGVIADCSTEIGEWITPAPPGIPIPAVLDLIDPGSVYVSAPIDEVDSARVKVGQEARITVDSRPGEHLIGRVVRVASYVLDVLEQNRTVEIEAEFENRAIAETLLPGTSADVEVILSRHDGVLRVPSSAVAAGGKVLVLADGRLAERTIKVGIRNWQFTEALEGLAPGEPVVIARDSAAIVPGALAKAQEKR